MRQDMIEKLKKKRKSDPLWNEKRAQKLRAQKVYNIHDAERKTRENAALKAQINEKKRKAKQPDEEYLDERSKREGRKLFKKKKYSAPESPQECPLWNCPRVHQKYRDELRLRGRVSSPKSCISDQSRRSRTPHGINVDW